MKVMCFGYRSWSLKIYERLKNKKDIIIEVINSYEDYREERIFDFDPDYILFYGWSWAVSKKIIEKYFCVMLHPSPLPKYRGGSPLQNQIINGETSSAVTLFKMNIEIDAGPIIFQKNFSLLGDLEDIFERISAIGYELTIRMLNEKIELKEQDHSLATYFRRRSPRESEITIDEIKSESATYIFNKIRMLQDPYPNAYIQLADGTKLYILKATID